MENNVLEIHIEDASISNKKPYVYILYSHEYNSLYVGETYSSRGALGRLSEHLSDASGNTFSQKIESLKNIKKITFGKVSFGAISLGTRSDFRSKGHREGVEMLLQYKLINKIADAPFNVAVVSAQSNSSYADVSFVKAKSDEVLEQIYLWLSDTVSGRSDVGPTEV